jgi:hypothetical protein
MNHADAVSQVEEIAELVAFLLGDLTSYDERFMLAAGERELGNLMSELHKPPSPGINCSLGDFTSL